MPARPTRTAAATSRRPSALVVVVYDIPSDRRRTRLHDRLLDFGTPVQYSVFECCLAPDMQRQLRAAVNAIIEPRADSVRYYTLCRACVDRVTTAGPGAAARAPGPAGPLVV